MYVRPMSDAEKLRMRNSNLRVIGGSNVRAQQLQRQFGSEVELCVGQTDFPGRPDFRRAVLRLCKFEPREFVLARHLVRVGVHQSPHQVVVHDSNQKRFMYCIIYHVNIRVFKQNNHICKILH